MKIKTSELTGAALDWAVADAEYKTNPPSKGWVLEYHRTGQQTWPYSTVWEWGGPIIEREGIAIDCIRCGGKVDGWIATLPMYCEAKYEDPSPTPLIAAMRCFVASRLGDAVEVPEALRE